MATVGVGFRTLALVALLLSAALVAGGCQSYREGNSRTVGEVVDDAAIQSRVKLALLNDPEIKALQVNTEVHRRVVVLHGRVATREQKQRAVELAAAVKGVVEVDDRLSIVTD